MTETEVPLQRAAREAAARQVLMQNELIDRAVQQAERVGYGVYVEYDARGGLLRAEPNRYIPRGEIHEKRRAV